jgi:hypothetical protein
MRMTLSGHVEARALEGKMAEVKELAKQALSIRRRVRVLFVLMLPLSIYIPGSVEVTMRLWLQPGPVERPEDFHLRCTIQMTQLRGLR